MKSGLNIHATFKVDPRDVGKFKQLIGANMLIAAKQPGCQYYAFAQDVIDGSLFHLSEGWSDRAALNAYNASAMFQATLAEVAANVRLEGRDAQLYMVSAQEAI